MSVTSSEAPASRNSTRDDHVDQWPGQRDDDLLAWLLGHALERGDATDRQHRHRRGGDAELTRRDDVAEFMQHDADEQDDDEDDALDCRIETAVIIIGGPDEGEEQEKGDVDADGSATDFEKLEGSAHRVDCPRHTR